MAIQPFVLGAAYKIIQAYCTVHALDAGHGMTLYKQMEAEAFKFKDDLLSDVDAVAQVNVVAMSF